MTYQPPKPQQIRRQRLKMLLVAVGCVCLGFAFTMIWVVTALWQMLFGR